MSLIYLDNNATTKVDERVLEAMLPYFKEEYANPSSIYDFAKVSNRAVKESRGIMKDFFNAENEKEIIFTSCGSESANTAIRGVLNMNKNKRHIITTKVEHPCVLNLYSALEKEGYRVDYIGVNSNGELDLAQLEDSMDDDTALVSVMYANNETGVIFPIEKISEIIKSKNKETKFFVDAVQVTGKIPIDVQQTGVDLMSISGHKFHAPKGIGALYVNSKTLITPLIIGGHQERGKRAGTENVAGIAAMAEALKEAQANMTENAAHVTAMRDRLIAGLRQIPHSALNGDAQRRLPGNVNFCFEGIEGESLLLLLDDKGICASSGSACTSGSLDPSHVLLAIGRVHDIAHGSLRLTLSPETTMEEIDYTIQAVKDVVAYLRGMSPIWRDMTEGRKPFILQD
mgnify:CR=1 FL=1